MKDNDETNTGLLGITNEVKFQKLKKNIVYLQLCQKVSFHNTQNKLPKNDQYR